jgi:membrane-associated phospholipid phosphatase
VGRLARIDQVDRRLFDLVRRPNAPLVDRALGALSTAASRSALWLALSGVMAGASGHRARRAAVRGVLAIAITSAVVNLPLKRLTRRRRPQRQHGDSAGLIRMPKSSSFPSGHAASAFAFATAVGSEEPRWLPVILPLAVGVAFSRVRLGVHYPSDVVVGMAIGASIGVATGPMIRRAGADVIGSPRRQPGGEVTPTKEGP